MLGTKVPLALEGLNEEYTYPFVTGTMFNPVVMRMHQIYVIYVSQRDGDHEYYYVMWITWIT